MYTNSSVSLNALAVSAAILVCSLVCLAQIPDKPTGYVTDTAHVISRDDVKRLESRCSQLDEAKRAQVAIVIINSLEGQPIEKATLDLFRKWGVGRKGMNDGIVLLLAMQDQRSRITVGYGLERIFTIPVATEVLT